MQDGHCTDNGGDDSAIVSHTDGGLGPPRCGRQRQKEEEMEIKGQVGTVGWVGPNSQRLKHASSGHNALGKFCDETLEINL